MRRATVFQVWNCLILAVALIPLAIFWTGRNTVFLPGEGVPDAHLAGHLWASALYLGAIALFVAWLRVPGGRGARLRGAIVGALAAAALAGSAVVFVEIGGTAVEKAGLEGLGFDVAVAIIVYLSAVLAAWVLAWSILAAVRRRAAR